MIMTVVIYLHILDLDGVFGSTILQFCFGIQTIRSNCCASVLGVLSGDCSDSDFYSPTLMLGFKEILTKHTFDKSEAKCNEAGGTLVKWTEGFNMFFESDITS